MRHKQRTPLGITALCLLLFSACTPGPKATPTPTQLVPAEPAPPTAAPPAAQTLPPAEDKPPTITPASTSTAAPSPTDTPEPTPTQAIVSDFIRRLCPNMTAPLGLFAAHEPYIDGSTDPETLYIIYQFEELGLDSPPEPCVLYLAPGPLDTPQLAGDTLFWKTFDHEAETVTIWGYDPLDELTDEAFPQHVPLLQTRIDTPIEKAGLVEFVASEDGEMLAWSFTDPRFNDDSELAYIQTIYAASPNGSTDQRPISEILFDVVPEAGGRPHIIRLQRISADKDLIYYTDEPVGLGRQWPEPLGRYTSLYSISTWGDAYPELHFDCSNAYWCISDFSEELDLLVSIQDSANEIQITRLSSGEMLGGIQAPEMYTTLRQALIGPDGRIAFLGIALGSADYGAAPEDVAVFYLEPPYTGEPVLVLNDHGLLNLLGWVSPREILADGNLLDGNQPYAGTIPSMLMLIDISAGAGDWLPRAASGFSGLVP